MSKLIIFTWILSFLYWGINSYNAAPAKAAIVHNPYYKAQDRANVLPLGYRFRQYYHSDRTW